MNEETKSQLEIEEKLLKRLLSSIENESKELEDIVKRYEGYSYGSSELVKKFDEFKTKKNKEFSDLVQNQKMNAGVANLLAALLNDSSRFLNNEKITAEKMYCVKQGELLRANSQKSKVEVMIGSIKGELEKMNSQIEQAENVINPSFLEQDSILAGDDTARIEESKNRIRPDKNPNTKIGRAAMEIERRRQLSKSSAAEESQNNSEKRKPRKPKK